MSNMYKAFYLLLCIISINFYSCADKQDESIQSLAQRVLPEHYKSFHFYHIDKGADEKDFFEIESKNGKIYIGGNNGVSQASGLNYYLENYCHTQVSVNCYSLQLPSVLPMNVKKERIETPYQYRYLFNYCTYGYTMPWWDWERWEKMIDYMALKGVNMPLSIIGQEAVWQDVYTKIGMDPKDIADFFVGPAHLPWGWMGNIDKMGGPLPKEWFTQRVALQKKILSRERSLGMTPVLQAFTGHVPEKLKDLYPNSQITRINDWAGVKGTMFLSPEDPLFQKISTLFLEKQTEMFGTDHLYDADCFIEVDPPTSNPDSIKALSKSLYQSMADVDPEAKWVIQGWFLFFRKEFWNDERSQAFFSGIPHDKVIAIDLYGEKNPVWDKTSCFYGQPWIWSVICNGDQKVNMSGALQVMQTELERAKKIGHKNLKGLGIIPEGIGYNDVVYDFIFSKIWSQDTVNLNTWIGDWAQSRYNSNDERIREYASYLLSSVYGRTRTMWSAALSTPMLNNVYKVKEDIRHERADIQLKNKHDFAWDFSVDTLAMAAKTLLDLSDKLADNEAYQFDLANVFRELIHSFSHMNIGEIAQAYYDKDEHELDLATQKLLKQLDDMDLITSTNRSFMLGPWLESAKSWGVNAEEKQFYDTNARTIITIWQPYESGMLRDYASRQWSGLLTDYYKPRWALFCQRLKESLETKVPFDGKAFDKDVRKMDYQWTLQSNVYPTEPTNDIVAVSKKIWQEYKQYFEN